MSTEILILSFIQGISEFLPISSSANLYLFSSTFDIKIFSFSMKIALHAGSLICLLFYFREEVLEIFRGLFSKRKNINETHFFQLVCGTIPVVISGFLAKDFVKEFDSPGIAGIFCVIFGILLYTFDKVSNIKSRSDKKPVSVIKDFIIGCFQAVSILPGVSRLGISITASRMLGIERKKAIFFSLLLAIPSICGSLTLEIIDCYNKNDSFTREFLEGIILTTIIGLIAIFPCIKYMERKGFFALMIYRMIIGTVICFLSL
jgi:undecaprenyl-diphosphatase